MENSRRTFNTLLFSSIMTLPLLLRIPTAMASFFGKSELSGKWKEKFQDVTKLNDYMKQGLKTEINDVVIKGYEIDDAIFNNTTFRDVEWTDTVTNGLSITNTVFRNNTFNNATFTDIKFTNVTFEDSEFNGISFAFSQMTGVKFIHCKFNAQSKSSFEYMPESTIEFDHSVFESGGTYFEGSTFNKPSANLLFNNSTIKDMRLTGLVFPSSLTFENCKLQNVEMSRSKLTKLVMDNVTGGGASGFGNGGSVVEVDIRNSDMAFGLGEGTLGKVSYVNSIIESSFRSANIKELHVINCKPMGHLNLYKAKIDTLQISNCPVNDLDTTNAIIQSFSIEKSTVVNNG